MSGLPENGGLLPGWLPLGCRVRCRGFPCLDTGKASKSGIFYDLSLSSATKATRFFKKIHKVRFTGQTVVYRFLEVRCRTSLPVLSSGLSLYGGSLWKKAKIRRIKSVSWWCGSFPGRSPCGKPLSSSLSARPANTSRNGGISGKWQKKLRKNG